MIQNKENVSDKDHDTNKRLDSIIRLLVAQLNSKEEYGMEKIYVMLNDSGLTSGEIGKIMNKSSKDISSILNNIKKRKMKKNE